MNLVAIDAVQWFHGTSASPFPEWTVPPPPVPGEALRLPHSSLFFTSDRAAAQRVGRNVCSVQLTDEAVVLDATQASGDTERLRGEVTKNPLARMCLYTRSSNVWVQAWRTGEVLRFASDDPQFDRQFQAYAAQYRGQSPDVRFKVAAHNWTRGWIEMIVVSAARLGFNALHGFEIDRHSGAAPIAVPWLAVTEARAVTLPTWV